MVPDKCLKAGWPATVKRKGWKPFRSVYEVEHNVKVVSLQYICTEHGVYSPSADNYWEERSRNEGVLIVENILQLHILHSRRLETWFYAAALHERTRMSFFNKSAEPFPMMLPRAQIDKDDEPFAISINRVLSLTPYEHATNTLWQGSVNMEARSTFPLCRVANKASVQRIGFLGIFPNNSSSFRAALASSHHVFVMNNLLRQREALYGVPQPLLLNVAPHHRFGLVPRQPPGEFNGDPEKRYKFLKENLRTIHEKHGGGEEEDKDGIGGVRPLINSLSPQKVSPYCIISHVEEGQANRQKEQR
ncbi:hypothetical protein I308_105712 [Cryptococcus tetragattii IND107]|uniref:Uncharacterized protein n=1 Tax=Cryptococcus tetragattii IND107 TaxID=1296105 RepID=A0ABR3BJW4_9TREE